MKKLANRFEFVEMLKNLLAVEKDARDRYVEESLSFNDENLRAVIGSIKKDEDRHIEMIGGLIGELEK